MNFPLPRKIFSQNVAVLGKTRSGKSTMLRGAVEDLLARNMPVCIVDPKGDWWGLKLAPDGKGPGFPVVIFGGEHADVPINPLAGAHVAELFATGNRPCLIDLKGWMPSDRTRFWIDFASSLFKHTKGLRWLVVDEAHNFAPKGKVLSPEAGIALHWSSRIASEGLGMGLHMMIASQRPQKVHNDVLTSCETLVAMKVLHPSDRDAVTEWLEGGGDPALTKTILGSLRDLERGEGWAWSPEAKFGPQRLQFPMFSTYDSFKPQDAGTVRRLKGWAAVDLDEVTKKLAAVVEEAKANDPATLKAEIRRLTAELAKKPAAAADPAALDAAQQAGYQDGYRTGRMHALGRADSDLNVLAEKVRAIDEPYAALVAALRDALTATAKARNEPFTPATGGTGDRFYREAPARPPASNTAAKGPGTPPSGASALRPSTGGANGTVAEGLSRPQQKILDALAWLEWVGSTGVDRVRVAMLADQSPKSSGFRANLSTLSGRGLLTYRGGDGIELTEDGRGLANKPAGNPTNAELHDAIRSKISGPQWAMLQCLIAEYPSELTREALAVHSNQSVTSSGFRANLSTLSGLGFVKYMPDAMVKATEILFVER